MKLKLLDCKEIVVENKSGKEIAASISESLSKECIAYKLNGKLYDLYSIVSEDGDFELITKKSPEAKNILNHSCAHLLADAIKSLYPDALFAIGPAIEDGFYYDIDFNGKILREEDLAKIENKMKEISKKNTYIIKKVISKDEALRQFANNPYKVEIISELDDQEISTYTQGDFSDLCIGPHVPSTGYIKFFKLESIAGAYWRGDSKNKQLTRIYGFASFTKEELEHHIAVKEEAKKRDHRKLGKELGLFMLSEYGPGFPFYLPNGLMLRRQIENWWYQIHDMNGYKIIKTPVILSKELWLTSGHWDHYKDNMYTTKIDDREFAIKPMNCPGSILVYNSELHSYRDLPLRLAELGLVHRHEASGALNGLFRVRCFTQDDAHIFCRRDQLQDEIVKLLKLYDEMYSVFGLDYSIVLSTRPEEGYIGDIEIWNESEKILADACKATGKDFKINPGDGAFYGPKLDFKLKDCMGRIWQCGTIQLDMNLPTRFDCTYIDQNGNKVRPIMLHRAILGSFERFLGIIIEHFGGAFPTWLAPVQIKILPVNNEQHLEKCKLLQQDLLKAGFRVEIDSSEEKLGYRLRTAQIKKIPYTLVIGDKECEFNTVTYRKFGTNEQINVPLEEFKTLLNKEIEDKKFLVDTKKI
ncbi:MAG: threonine--tRNA ligase [Candidatus Onthovivens sp.]|nr:threonine--tRNA ligase [Candidatus Onthovivens sp.]